MLDSRYRCIVEVIGPGSARNDSMTTRNDMRHPAPASRIALALRLACAGFMGLATAACWTVFAVAKVETWRQEGPTAFAKSHRQGVVISDTGRVRLGHAISPFAPLKADRVWDLARTGSGVVYAATGDAGKIFRREPGAKSEWSLVFDSSDSQALSVVACPDGTVYAGTGPSGNVVNLTDPKHPASRPDPKVQYIWDL